MAKRKVKGKMTDRLKTALTDVGTWKNGKYVPAKKTTTPKDTPKDKPKDKPKNPPKKTPKSPPKTQPRSQTRSQPSPSPSPTPRKSTQSNNDGTYGRNMPSNPQLKTQTSSARHPLMIPNKRVGEDTQPERRPRGPGSRASNKGNARPSNRVTLPKDKCKKRNRRGRCISR